jgi:cell pole-organizing protein PopZ
MNNSWGCDITRGMRHPVYDEEVFMEEALAAIRRAITDDEAGEMTLAPTARSSHDKTDAGLLSREATTAVGSAFNALTETVKKHEPTLEDVVRDTLRPMLKSWLDENLPSVVERMVQEEIERVTRKRGLPFPKLARPET